jgi:hypothetical protein
MNKKKKILLLIILIYTIIQIICVTSFKLPFVSDSFRFYDLAQKSMAIGKFYPNLSNLSDDYIVSPVYVNYNYLLLSICNTPIIIQLFNILLNLSLLLLIYKITCKLFDETCAFTSAIIYILYLTNMGLILSNLSESLFGVFVFASIYLYLSKDNIYNAVVCGLCIGIAFGIRPFAIAILFSFLLILIYQIRTKQKHDIKKIYLILSGFLLIIISIGSISKKNIGDFICTPGSGALNLALSSNDDATGVYSRNILVKDSVWNAKTTYYEKNAYLKEKSISWLKQHPFNYFKTIPRKIYSTFISDDWVVSQLLNTRKWDFNRYIKSLKSEKLKNEFSLEDISFKTKFLCLNFYHQIIYLSILLFFILHFFYFYRHKLMDQNIFFLYLLLFLGYCSTFIISVGTPRYKYPFFLIIIILISPVINALYLNITKKLKS